MTLQLTISIVDRDDPRKKRCHVVNCNDLWDAIFELREIAGPAFAKELMATSWDALTRPQKASDGDEGISVIG